MPIKGSTSREALEAKGSKQLEVGGTISKGLPRTEEDIRKNRPGKEADYFVLRLRGKYDTPLIRESFEAEFGAQPKVLQPVFVVGRTYEEAFPTNMEAWGKSGLMIRCDGESQLEWWDEQSGRMRQDCKACIAPRCDCKRAGRLFIVLPSLAKRTGVYCQFMLTTHSIRDTERISAGLLWAEGLGLKLYQIPFVLEREAEEIKIPMKDKDTGTFHRGKAVKYFVKLSIEPGFVRQVGAPQYMALPASISAAAENVSNGHAPGWANEKTVEALVKQAGEKLGLNTSDIEGFTEFAIRDYAAWNRGFADIATAARFLKESLNEVLSDDDDLEPEEARQAQAVKTISMALAEAGVPSGVVEMIEPDEDAYRITVPMGPSSADLKAIRKSAVLRYIRHDDTSIWVQLKGE